MTELATKKNSTAHDRARHAKAGAHDSVASCCVVISEAMCVQQTKPGARQTRSDAHDRP